MLTGGSRRVPLPARTLTFRSPRYWPVLDNALRAAAFSRQVQVRLLVSCWLNTDPSMFSYLRSLQAFSDPAINVSVDVVRTHSLGRAGPGWAGRGRPSSHPRHAPSLPPKKVFIVPVGNHSNIPFSRVNHSKFMVTEKAAYIGEPQGEACGGARPGQPQDP